jgi:hypothetical protein
MKLKETEQGVCSADVYHMQHGLALSHHLCLCLEIQGAGRPGQGMRSFATKKWRIHRSESESIVKIVSPTILILGRNLGPTLHLGAGCVHGLSDILSNLHGKPVKYSWKAHEFFRILWAIHSKSTANLQSSAGIPSAHSKELPCVQHTLFFPCRIRDCT